MKERETPAVSFIKYAHFNHFLKKTADNTYKMGSLPYQEFCEDLL